MNSRASFVGILSHSNVQFSMRAPRLNTNLLLDLCKAPCSLCHRSSPCLLRNRFSIRLRPTNGTHLNLDRNELNWHQNIKLLCLFQSDFKIIQTSFYANLHFTGYACSHIHYWYVSSIKKCVWLTALQFISIGLALHGPYRWQHAFIRSTQFKTWQVDVVA